MKIDFRSRKPVIEPADQSQISGTTILAAFFAITAAIELLILTTLLPSYINAYELKSDSATCFGQIIRFQLLPNLSETPTSESYLYKVNFTVNDKSYSAESETRIDGFYWTYKDRETAPIRYAVKNPSIAIIDGADDEIDQIYFGFPILQAVYLAICTLVFIKRQFMIDAIRDRTRGNRWQP